MSDAWCVVCGTTHRDAIVSWECQRTQAEETPNPDGSWPE